MLLSIRVPVITLYYPALSKHAHTDGGGLEGSSSRQRVFHLLPISFAELGIYRPSGCGSSTWISNQNPSSCVYQILSLNMENRNRPPFLNTTVKHLLASLCTRSPQSKDSQIHFKPEPLQKKSPVILHSTGQEKAREKPSISLHLVGLGAGLLVEQNFNYRLI